MIIDSIDKIFDKHFIFCIIVPYFKSRKIKMYAICTDYFLRITAYFFCNVFKSYTGHHSNMQCVLIKGQ